MEIKMYKKCSNCKEEKLFSEFSKNKLRKDGYHNECKVCVKDYKVRNKKILAVKQKLYNEINKEKISENRKRYYELNKKTERSTNKAYSAVNRARIYANNAKRRAIKLKATPEWLSQDQLEEIVEFYQIAQAFRLYTGQEYHVDHIVPLQGENVCGLHVPWNLQIILASENLRKSNKLLQ